MKRILFFFLLTALPFLAAAQGTIPDTIRVLTDAQISFGKYADSVRMYFIQGGTWKKQRMDTLAQYVATKIGGVTTFSAGTTGFTPSTATSGVVTLAGTLNVANGGTGATTASQARTNLGLAIGTDVLAPNGSAANLTNFPTLNQNTTGTAANVTGTVAIANGGTNATTASQARTNLGLAIGTDVLAPNGSAANLTSFPTLNQNTTGSAASLTTARDIQVNLASTSAASFNGTANIQPGVTGQLGGGNIADGAISGAKTNFAGVSGDAARLLGAVSGGTTDTVQVGGGLAMSGGVLRSKQDTSAIILACSDETTNITTGTAKVTFRVPFALTVVGLRANVNTAPTGADIIVDVNKVTTSIMTTNLLRISAGQKTSIAGGTTQPNITTTSFASDDEITIDFDQVGSTAAGKGLKVTILYIRP